VCWKKEHKEQCEAQRIADEKAKVDAKAVEEKQLTDEKEKRDAKVERVADEESTNLGPWVREEDWEVIHLVSGPVHLSSPQWLTDIQQMKDQLEACKMPTKEQLILEVSLTSVLGNWN